ncbi:DUF2513 domain-containing protein [Pseudomonas sp. GD03858]|uniref:hypothetical protein n=1 Tax=unclassified Pseudomonas TaxID=196821 RepID=UPI0024498BE3|nr:MULTISPECIES: hypothetical protein [unclassified Pseudomonas]MDH0646201.1 DUF2513 domain-containing protein [Pseudomonas sp. GD03867]MDH0661800.1 DUF2513 domain-containing protein [Pseudomonas sp. GD03858]
MKRNQRVARLVLAAIEQGAGLDGIELFSLSHARTLSGVSLDDWDYAFKLLLNGGYVTLEDPVVHLTWKGHDLLDMLVLSQG